MSVFLESIDPTTRYRAMSEIDQASVRWGIWLFEGMRGEFDCNAKIIDTFPECPYLGMVIRLFDMNGKDILKRQEMKADIDRVRTIVKETKKKTENTAIESLPFYKSAARRIKSETKSYYTEMILKSVLAQECRHASGKREGVFRADETVYRPNEICYDLEFSMSYLCTSLDKLSRAFNRAF